MPEYCGNYYNEIDKHAAAWLRNLIAAGEIPDGFVDQRSIADVKPSDLVGYTQCHFFCGIAGWPLALRLAGIPDDFPCWTGSCPCQPFSAAGKGEGSKDARHLWPEMFRLIKACRPPIIFGEQVASAEVVGSQLEADFIVAVQGQDFARANKFAKRLVAQKSFGFDPRWVDGISSDLASEDYAVGFEVLGAHSVGAPHIRQRLFWVADASDARCSRRENAGAGPGDEGANVGGSVEPERSVPTDRLANAHRPNARLREPGEQGHAGSGRNRPAIDGTACGLGNTTSGGLGVDGSASGSGGYIAQPDATIRLADTNGRDASTEREQCRGEQRQQQTDGCGDAAAIGLGFSNSAGPLAGREASETDGYGSSIDAAGGDVQSRDDGVGNPVVAGLEGHTWNERDGHQPRRLESRTDGHAAPPGPWSDYAIIATRDGKFRRVPAAVEPEIFCVADGLPGSVGRPCTRRYPLATKTKGRVGRLKGYGNAIVPALAAEFICASMEAIASLKEEKSL